jgi:predicted dinucleotide-binding enzyme
VISACVRIRVNNPDSERAQALRAELGTKVTIGSAADPVFNGVQADLFYCGPGDDRDMVEQLITDVGLNPMRLGDADQVGLVDSVASLWFALALGQGRGRHLAFKVLSR